MPYDDDSSRFGFKDLIDLQSFIDSYLNQPENLTLGRLTAVIRGLSPLVEKQDLRVVSVYDAHSALEQHGLANLPMSTVVGILDAMQPFAGQPDITSRLTLRDLEGILAKAGR